MQECQGLGTVGDLLLVNLLFESHFWKRRSIAITGAKKSLQDEEDQEKTYQNTMKSTKPQTNIRNFPVLCSNEGRQEMQMHPNT